MATAYFCEWPQFDPDAAARVAERVNQQLGNQPPAGGIYHAEGPTGDGGWWTFNVWTSDEAYATFRRQILYPALDAENVSHGDLRQLPLQWESSRPPGAP